MPRIVLAFLALVATAAPGPAQTAPGSLGRWIVVPAPALRDAVEPLADLRRAEGFEVHTVDAAAVVAGQDSAAGAAAALRDHVARLCRDDGQPSCILLVGAVEPPAGGSVERVVVPPLAGTISRMRGQPTDNGYGQPGADLVPRVPVGRLPARSLDEARQMVAKTLAAERDTRPGPWRRQLTVLAGAPEFTPVVDALVERMALARLGQVDPSWQGRALYHNPHSRFTLPDPACNAAARALVEEGQALTLYLGHSNAHGFYANRHRYLDRDDWAELEIARGPGVFATFGCFGCQLSGKDGEGYGIAAVRNPRGPVAVLGSHGLCFAAMVKLASEAFTESFLGPEPPARLGESWLALRRGLARDRIDPVVFGLLDAVDGSPKIPQRTQRLEHQEMFVLLGDPALRLPAIPKDLRLSADAEVAPGGTVELRGQAPARLEGAVVRVTVERPRDSEPARPAALPEGPPSVKARALAERHQRANDFVLARQEATVQDGRFAVTCPLPAELPWRRLHVRAYAATDDADAQAVLTLEVRKE